uniref:neurofilament heavy polypeptide n=1 Tax=Semicossyphus pulcher TaxID=241346 RepID=UPI0037E92A07
MKLQLFLPLSIVASVILVGVIKMRKKEHDKEDRRSKFQEIKLRVTYDVLGEYQNERSHMESLLGIQETALKVLEEEFEPVKTKKDKAEGEVKACLSGQTVVSGELGVAEQDLNNIKADNEKQKTSWDTEVDTLKQKLAARSEVCNHLKPGSSAASQLCGGEEVKAEAPKPEEAKAEAPKPEEAKAEAPKPEEAKAEAPKPEEAKAEAPKPEEAKAEAPKPEEAKAEAPKPEEAKAEAPKPEEAKAEAPKPEEAKAEAPKPEEAKAEAPKPEEAKAEAPKPEEAKAEAPKPEEAKAEAPKKA